MNPDDASTQLLALCAAGMTRMRRPWRLAISGLPGCGKSTLAQALVARARKAGWPALALSLDDFYLPRRARLQLAKTRHPLFATRGVPGTHDLALLQSVLRQLGQASPDHPVRVPRFDKGRDTRRSPSHWRCVRHAPRLVILEGWCLGVMPQPASALIQPINALERRHDRDTRWRTRVNTLLRDYLSLWDEADARVLIASTSWPHVKRLRDRAEDARRRERAPHAMDAAQLTQFLAHYERLGRHALATPPAHADLILPTRR
ncbi:MAG TPA: kinase [Rhodanobacteraceae bacterium]